MASWVDKLEKHGGEITREYKRRKPKPKIETVIVTVRPSNDLTGDPGECRIQHYYVQDGRLTLCDENGKVGKEPLSELVTEDNARLVAVLLTKKKWVESKEESDFNRRLNYPPLGWL